LGEDQLFNVLRELDASGCIGRYWQKMYRMVQKRNSLPSYQ